MNDYWQSNVNCNPMSHLLYLSINSFIFYCYNFIYKFVYFIVTIFIGVIYTRVISYCI